MNVLKTSVPRNSILKTGIYPAKLKLESKLVWSWRKNRFAKISCFSQNNLIFSHFVRLRKKFAKFSRETLRSLQTLVGIICFCLFSFLPCFQIPLSRFSIFKELCLSPVNLIFLCALNFIDVDSRNIFVLTNINRIQDNMIIDQFRSIWTNSDQFRSI